ncbi:hypothetical protein QFZ94_000079 [Paraburkholderia sp. JPY465]|uniref:hypothetical protein n=1 Tax=Paraburkholderia sp. JPY465 TaxID=3042285 RepID=UPI003D2472E3
MTQNTRSGVGRLSDDKRKAIALQALTRTEPISVLAERNGVSRPTVYRQIGTASVALDEAFDTTRAADADQVLFMLPVTRQWLDQVIVALTMVGHVSFRSTLELMHDLLGVSTSLGTIHTVLQRAAKQAIAINAGIDLSPIRVGLHDELFQGSQPVLAGIDVASTYCYLLAPEAHRDGDTWAIHLLDLQAQGLDPEHTIADAGTGLRAGQKMAGPDTPCHGDVFHIIQHGKSLATLWHRVASGARTGREQLEARLANPRRRGEDSLLEAALETLRRNEAHAHELAADLRTLVQWLDVTSCHWLGRTSRRVNGCSISWLPNCSNVKHGTCHVQGHTGVPFRTSATACSLSRACSTQNSTPLHERTTWRAISCARSACCIASPKRRVRSGKGGIAC